MWFSIPRGKEYSSIIKTMKIKAGIDEKEDKGLKMLWF